MIAKRKVLLILRCAVILFIVVGVGLIATPAYSQPCCDKQTKEAVEKEDEMIEVTKKAKSFLVERNSEYYKKYFPMMVVLDEEECWKVYFFDPETYLIGDRPTLVYEKGTLKLLASYAQQ